jgi:predicted esterase
MAIKDPGNHFYSDLPAVDQKKWVDQLVKHPALASQTQVTHLAYPYYPITYVYCEDDQMIPFEVQKLLVEKRKAEGVEVTEKWWPGGHSPFLTMPERILELLESEK